MSTFSFVHPKPPRQNMRIGRIAVLLAIGVSTFAGVSIAGMMTAQAPAPPTEYTSQLATDTGGEPDGTSSINSDMTKERPRGTR
jgi:hypothetical protein